MGYVVMKDVSKIIKKKQILDHISFSLEKGTITTLVGANGSGKTMILRALCGLIKIDEGKIVIDDKRLIFNKDLPVNTGVIIENCSFLDDRTGYENLKLLADIRKTTGEEEILGYMKKFDMYEYRNTKMKEYSLGMRKKIEIIQAVMEDQELILLDEPTNALDEKSISIFINLIKELKSRNKTIIVATHDKMLSKSIADNEIRLYEGKIVE